MQGTPELRSWGVPVTVIGATVIGLTAHFSSDFAAFAGGAVAIVGGLAASRVVMMVSRPFGTAWRVHRLAESCRRALSRAARHGTINRGTINRDDPVEVMLDRFDAVAVRAAADVTPTSVILTELRIAFNVMELRRLTPMPDRRLGIDIERALQRVASHVETMPRPAFDTRLCAALDTALRRAVVLGSDAAALPLAGLRRALLPDAAPLASENEHEERRT
jgi:uncharacterized membrane protein YccC